MEERMYERQVTKLALASRLFDDKQIERHFSASEMSLLYDLTLLSKSKEVLTFPNNDPLLAEVVQEHKMQISSIHEHDSLLQNKFDEHLSDDERQKAWETFNQTKELQKMLPTKVQQREFFLIFRGCLEDVESDDSTQVLHETDSKDSFKRSLSVQTGKEYKARKKRKIEDTIWQKDSDWAGVLKWKTMVNQLETPGFQNCQVSFAQAAKSREPNVVKTGGCDLPTQLYFDFLEKSLIRRPQKLPTFIAYILHVDQLNRDLKQMMRNHYAIASYTDEKNAAHSLLLTIFKSQGKELLLGNTLPSIIFQYDLDNLFSLFTSPYSLLLYFQHFQ